MVLQSGIEDTNQLNASQKAEENYLDYCYIKGLECIAILQTCSLGYFSLPALNSLASIIQVLLNREDKFTVNSETINLALNQIIGSDIHNISVMGILTLLLHLLILIEERNYAHGKTASQLIFKSNIPVISNPNCISENASAFRRIVAKIGDRYVSVSKSVSKDRITELFSDLLNFEL